MTGIIKTNNSDTPEQIKFSQAPIKGGKSIILSATAGSGKTKSAVAKLKFMLENGVDPKRIIFFSFTVAAVKELQSRVQNDDIKITTIHSYCTHLLGRMRKMKKISGIYDFIEWFKEHHKPKYGSNKVDLDKFYLDVERLYDAAEYYANEIAAFKLQTADNIKCKLPDYLKEYQDFQKQTKCIDFSDMLVMVRDALKEDKWLKIFRNQFDYIFIDEYQDTSTIQMQILLALNAKHYYLMGDKSQSIYGYSGANCDAIESMLKKRRDTEVMNLSVNFRSKKSIVENSNKYSNLKAVPFSEEDGKVHGRIILFENLIKVIQENPYVAVLARTNSVIKEIERRLLNLKIPIRYENFLKESELADLERAEARQTTKNKIRGLLPHFGTAESVIEFIRSNRDKQSFITSIHKSKGREFPICVVVNSISPEMLESNNLKVPKEYLKFISFDPADEQDYEARNVHYVAISRPQDELYFMLFENDL